MKDGLQLVAQKRIHRGYRENVKTTAKYHREMKTKQGKKWKL
jgi:hypothetical protein